MQRTIAITLSLSFVMAVALLATVSIASAEEATSSTANQTTTTPQRGLPRMLPLMNPQSDACPLMYAPVCGDDGQTYGNTCLAKKKGITNYTNGPCNKEERAINRGEVKEKMLDRRGGSTSEMMRERAAERMEEHVKNQLKRFVSLLLAAIDRMERLIERIESRADKLDENGVDTTSARDELEKARDELAAAESDLATIRDYSVSILASRNMAAVSNALSPVRETLRSAREHLRNAHEFIKSAVEKLKEAARTARDDESDDTASTTEE